MDPLVRQVLITLVLIGLIYLVALASARRERAADDIGAPAFPVVRR